MRIPYLHRIITSRLCFLLLATRENQRFVTPFSLKVQCVQGRHLDGSCRTAEYERRAVCMVACVDRIGLCVMWISIRVDAYANYLRYTVIFS